MPPLYNIGVDVCDKWAEREPDRVAIIEVREDGPVRVLSFAGLRALSNQTANLLADHGIGRGDRVGILLPQAAETAYSHIAVYKLGGIAIPLFTLFGEEALAFRLPKARPSSPRSAGHSRRWSGSSRSPDWPPGRSISMPAGKPSLPCSRPFSPMPTIRR